MATQFASVRGQEPAAAWAARAANLDQQASDISSQADGFEFGNSARLCAIASRLRDASKQLRHAAEECRSEARSISGGE